MPFGNHDAYSCFGGSYRELPLKPVSCHTSSRFPHCRRSDAEVPLIYCDERITHTPPASCPSAELTITRNGRVGPKLLQIPS